MQRVMQENNSHSKIRLENLETVSKLAQTTETQKIFQKSKHRWFCDLENIIESPNIEQPANRMTRMQYFNSSKMHMIKDRNTYRFDSTDIEPK